LLKEVLGIVVILLLLVLTIVPVALSQDRFHITRVDIVGNVNTDKEEILKVLNIGDEIDKDTLKASLQRLLETGLFSNVDGNVKVEGDNYILIISVKENPILKSIELTGNKEIKIEELKSLITLKDGEILNFNILKKDLENIAKLYKERGYTAANFQFSISNDGVLNIIINEGPVVSGFNFLGNSVIDSSSLSKELDTYKGRVISNNLLKEIALKIQDLYKSKGYVASTVLNAYVDNKGVLTFEIAEGKLASIEIKGNQKTKDYVILREMSLKPGDILNVSSIQKDLRKIYNLGYFSDLNVSLKSAETPGEVVLIVQVVEQPTGQLSGSLVYSTTEGFSVALGLSDSNLLGTGRKLGLSLNVGLGLTTEDLSLNYTEPYLANTDATLNSVVIWKKGSYTETIEGDTVKYNEDRKSLDINLNKSIGNDLYGILGVSFNNFQYQPQEGYSLPEVISPGTSNSITLGVSQDTRDVQFSPQKGNYHTISVENGGGLLGGDFNFTKLNTDFRWYGPISENEILAVNYMWGIGLGNIPYIEKYNVGGFNSIRGLPENWKKSDITELLSFEYRLKYDQNVIGVIFWDLGNGWNNNETVAPADFKMGVGLGLRIMVPPMGVIRMDYGWGSTDWQGRFYFSIGEKF
jgi:outer membrane protein insertion porin family